MFIYLYLLYIIFIIHICKMDLLPLSPNSRLQHHKKIIMVVLWHAPLRELCYACVHWGMFWKGHVVFSGDKEEHMAGAILCVLLCFALVLFCSFILLNSSGPISSAPFLSHNIMKYKYVSHQSFNNESSALLKTHLKTC